MAFVFEVDGTSLYPKCLKIKYSLEPIWSSNTRRNASARMTGNIKGWKDKLEISYTMKLTQVQLRTVKNALANNVEWHSVRYTNEVGQVVTKSMYVSEISVEPYWFADGEMRYQSISFSLIER